MKVGFSSKPEFAQIRRALLKSDLFQYPETDKNNVLLGLSVAKRNILQILFEKRQRFEDNSSLGYDVGIIVSNEREFKSKAEYVMNCSADHVTFGISKSKEFIPSTFVLRILYSVLIGICHLMLMPVLFFSKYDKRNLVTLPEIMLRFISVAIFFRKSCCEKLYLFYIWHSDTNLLERWLERQGIPVYLVPLENPISLFSLNLTGSRFVSVLPYQNEEIEYFYKVAIPKKNNWPIEASSKIGWANKSSYFSSTKIGIYSHGSFARMRMNHSEPNIGDLRSEIEFFKSLRSLVDLKKWTFEIHLHPKEKINDQILNWSINNYRSLLGDQIEFADFNESTYSQIVKCDFAMGSISSILFERQAQGFKTLIYADRISNFPIPNSKMRELVASNATELLEKMESLMNMSLEEYQREFLEYIYSR